MARRARYSARIYQADFFVVRALAAFVSRQVDACVAPGARILDVGCGEQPFREAVERHGAEYLGLDVVQNAAVTVRVVGQATDIPLRGRSVDVVLCTEVLEHVPDPAAALREVARVLRPGGTAVITSPFLYPLHEEPFDFGRITPHQLRRLAAANGLAIAELELAGNELEVIATVWCNLWSRLGTRKGARGTALAFLRVLARTPVNVAAAVGTRALRRVLPRKAYLCTLCVLRKAT
jgi:SAM-dependent methyltransferase